FGAAARISAVTLVAERTARPSYSAIAFFSSGAFSPVRTSTSTPRCLKIATACWLSSSAIRTFGMCAPRLARSWMQLRPGPVEPGEQGLEVRGLDGGAGPDAQAGWGVAIGADVVGDALLRQQVGDAAGRLGVGDLEADGRRGADGGVLCEELDPGSAFDPGRDGRQVGFAAGDQRRQAADRFGPAEAVERVLDAQHRGRVDGVAFEDAFDQVAA